MKQLSEISIVGGEGISKKEHPEISFVGVVSTKQLSENHPQ